MHPQRWVRSTGIVRDPHTERVRNNTLKRRKPPRKKLPMSERNIVNFMKHVLEYRRKEARARAASNKAKYAIKMAVRRCAAVSAENREKKTAVRGAVGPTC